MSDIKIVPVELGEDRYEICIGSGLLNELGTRLKTLLAPERVTVITDQNVSRLYARRVVDSLEAVGIGCKTLTIPPGESSKSWEMAQRLYDGLAHRRHTRTHPVVALGGGVVGDLAGFVAATWMRGVPVVQCPTSLEAAIDAAVGGKTAINHEAGKNLIGAFHQPRAVICDVDCMQTLDARHFRAALAESIKHAVIRDPAFLDWHEQHLNDVLALKQSVVTSLIARNCEIKAAVVADDEREVLEGPPQRAALNFGHTFGHAFETLPEIGLLHGEAVALGIVAELELAVRHFGFSEADRNRVESLLFRLQPTVNYDLAAASEAVFEKMRLDKKVVGGVRFAIPDRLGQTRWLENIPFESLRAALSRVIGRFGLSGDR